MADENAQETKATHQVPDDVGAPDDAEEPKRKFFKKRQREEDAPAEEETPQAGFDPSKPESQLEREPEPEIEIEDPQAVAEATPEISTEELASAAPEPETIEAAGTSADTSSPPPDSPLGADERSETPAWAPELTHGPATDRPELLVAGAFVGGLVFAQILKRFGRD